MKKYSAFNKKENSNLSIDTVTQEQLGQQATIFVSLENFPRSCRANCGNKTIIYRQARMKKEKVELYILLWS